MIFKKLFKSSTPKWQSEDANVRLEALNEMSLDDPKDKAIIEQFALEDSSDKVRRTALERLNDFSFWVQASNKDKNERVKKVATEQVRQGLLGEGDLSVDDTIKQDFIRQCNKTPLLEEIALKDKDEQTRFSLLNRLGKNNLFVQTLQDSQASEWLKTQVIDKLDDLAQLEKLAKKADDKVKAILQDKIEKLREAIEKPKQLQKEVGLVLAKLNALKDKNDFAELEQRHQQLVAQWGALKDQFDILTEEQISEFQTKFVKITTSLNNIMAPLKEKWQQQQQEQADQAQKATNKQAISERLAQVEATLTQAISEHNAQDEQQYAEALKQIRQDMQQMNLHDGDKNHFIAQMEQFHQKIEQIPLITGCVNQAMDLVKKLSQMEVPKETQDLANVYDDYKQWRKDWRHNQTKMGLALPSAITNSYEQLTKDWDGAIEPLLKEQEQQFAQTRKALSDLRFLLNGGKYRRAFGLFKKVSFMMEQLNEQQQGRLSRDFDSVKAKVEELADWQEYIATPRKQQLLEEMQDLANNPVDSPQEQAQKVKFTRQMWNSLGRSNDDTDQQINTAFDEACEKAFEVCRNFYAEQEALRERNLTAKLAVCEGLEQATGLLEQDPIPWQQIESQLAAARKEFKAAGDVDREKIKEINQTFYDLLNPLQKRLRAYHDENATLKEQLVNKAKALIEVEDVFDATNQLKELQKQWKTIGFAGGKVDGAIWRKFREVNDQIFAKRDEVKNQRNEANQAQTSQLQQQLEQIEQSVKEIKERSGINKLHSELQTVAKSVKEQAKSVQVKVGDKLNQLEDLIAKRKKELKLAAQREKYLALFAQLEHVSQDGELNSDIELASQWQDLLAKLPEQGDFELRYDLTLQLEIVAGVESPVRDTDRRMSLQMELLSDKMSGGELAQQDELLKSWIAVGRLQSDDEQLFDRVKAIYLT